MAGRVAAESDVRFWEKVKPDDRGCLIWMGGRDRRGYGRFWDGNRTVRAHRWAYESIIGPIPLDRPVIMHSCDTPLCVYPDHLSPGTLRDNTADAVLKGRVNTAAANAAHRSVTHCPQGHPYDEENTHTRPNGWRLCRACRRAQWRAWKARQVPSV